MTDTTAGPDPRSQIVRQRLDPGAPTFMSAFGAKGSGKSVLASAYWRSWPYNCLSIDPTGDFDAGPGDDVEVLTGELPGRLPIPEEGRKRWVYRPDPGSATYADDMDQAAGLAFWTPPEMPFLLQIDEIHELTGANRTGPNMRRVLHQHRHRNLSVITCGPRTKDIDPLVLSQSDYAYAFRMPHPLDQERFAAVCGVDPKVFADTMRQLPTYGYLRYDARPDPTLVTALARADRIPEEAARDQLRLLEFPPIPYEPGR